MAKGLGKVQKVTLKAFSEFVRQVQEFEAKTRSTFQDIFRNTKGILDLAYSATINVAIIRKILADKLGITDEMFIQMVEVELAERKVLEENMRKKLLEEQRLKAIEKMTTSLKPEDDQSKSALNEESEPKIFPSITDEVNLKNS